MTAVARLLDRVAEIDRRASFETIFAVKLERAEIDAAAAALAGATGQDAEPPRGALCKRIAASHESGHCITDATLGTVPRVALIFYEPARRDWCGHVVPRCPVATAALETLPPATLATLLLAAFGGAAGAVTAVGPAGLAGAHHELLAAQRLAERLRPGDPPAPIMLAAFVIACAVIERHRRTFDRLRRRLERRHRLDADELARLLRHVRPDPRAPARLLSFVDNPQQEKTT